MRQNIGIIWNIHSNTVNKLQIYATTLVHLIEHK